MSGFIPMHWVPGDHADFRGARVEIHQIIEAKDGDHVAIVRPSNGQKFSCLLRALELPALPMDAR